VKLPLFKEPELHLLLVVTKTIVLAIHYTDASRYRQQKQGRPHTLSHTAYSKYSIFINLFYRRLWTVPPPNSDRTYYCLSLYNPITQSVTFRVKVYPHLHYGKSAKRKRIKVTNGNRHIISIQPLWQ
jgi:hypothetical protein